MNDIVRTNIKERLVKAIESEKLLAQDVAAIFQMHPSYISWFKNVKYWDKIGEKFWERVLAWINSGQSLREWSEKHGKVLNENSPTDTKRDKTGTETKETVPEPLKIDINLHDLATYPRKESGKESNAVLVGIVNDPKDQELKYKPNTKNRLHPINLEKKPEPRLSRGEMVDLLLAEKALLKTQIEAIDVLLKHYIS